MTAEDATARVLAGDVARQTIRRDTAIEALIAELNRAAEGAKRLADQLSHAPLCGFGLRKGMEAAAPSVRFATVLQTEQTRLDAIYDIALSLGVHDKLKESRREAPEGELVGQSTVRITHNGKTETVSKDAASVQRYLLTLSPTEKTP